MNEPVAADDLTVIAASRIWLDEATERAPQLGDKALLDLVNGLAVVDDHLRSRISPQSIVGRFWEAVSGRSRQRQYLIDLNLRAGLGAAAEWLTELQHAKATSDLALERVARRLMEIEDEVVRQAGVAVARQVEMAALAAAFQSEIGRLDHAVGQLRARLDRVNSKIEAQAALTAALSGWRTGRLNALPPVVRAFYVVDMLWWGAFGRCLRATGGDEITIHLQRTLEDGVAEQLARDLGLGNDALFAISTLATQIGRQSDAKREELAFLTAGATERREPILAVICAAANGAPLPVGLEVPRALSARSLAARLLVEAERSAARRLAAAPADLFPNPEPNA